VGWLTTPWQYGWFVRGMAAAVLSGALCGLVGTFIVLRRMSYIGHGLSHAVLGGAVVGYELGTGLVATGAAWGAASALLITAVARTRKVGADAAIGIVTTASYAIGVAIISRGHSFTRNFEAVFFGNVLGVFASDLWLLVAVSAGVSIAIFFLYKQLVFVTFDPEVAATYGVRTGLVDVVFSLVLAAAIVATMRVLGVTLIAAAVVTPAVVARLSTDSFARMLGLSVMVGALTGFIGMYVSNWLDIASGATITLAASALFVVVYITSRWRGSTDSLAMIGHQ
jgi:manganese/iron transport system permease protein/iron/zinc/copper transport system permease protein